MFHPVCHGCMAISIIGFEEPQIGWYCPKCGDRVSYQEKQVREYEQRIEEARLDEIRREARQKRLDEVELRLANINWNDVTLGSMTDTNLAKKLGVSGHTVGRERSKRGIPPYTHTRRYPNSPWRNGNNKGQQLCFNF